MHLNILGLSSSESPSSNALQILYLRGEGILLGRDINGKRTPISIPYLNSLTCRTSLGSTGGDA